MRRFAHKRDGCTTVIALIPAQAPGDLNMPPGVQVRGPDGVIVPLLYGQPIVVLCPDCGLKVPIFDPTCRKLAP